jgi:hypothetical protein
MVPPPLVPLIVPAIIRLAAAIWFAVREAGIGRLDAPAFEVPPQRLGEGLKE